MDQKTEVRMVLMLHAMGSLWLDPQHRWQHFNYCFPDPKKVREMSEMVNRYTKNPSLYTKRALDIYRSYSQSQQENLLAEIEQACGCYLYAWDFPSSTKKLKDMVSKLKVLVGFL